MKKDNTVYIGSTPQKLTRAGNELALRKFTEANSKLMESLTKMSKNTKQYS